MSAFSLSPLQKFVHELITYFLSLWESHTNSFTLCISFILHKRLLTPKMKNSYSLASLKNAGKRVPLTRTKRIFNKPKCLGPKQGRTKAIPRTESASLKYIPSYKNP